MRNQKKFVTIMALVLAILMVLTMFTGIFANLMAQGRSIADIDREINEARSQMNQLQSQSNQIQEQMAGIAGRLATLREQEGSYLEELAVLQEQLQLLEERIELTEAQIGLYMLMIADMEVRLEEAIEREEEQLALYRRRVRAMEERGPTSYIQLLLQARSFSDLIARIHDAEEIMAFDQRVGEQLERYRLAVHEYKIELVEERTELEILVARLEVERAQLDEERAEVQERIDEIEARIEAHEIEFEELYAEQERMAREIQRHTANLGNLDAARQQALRDMENQVGAGGGGGGGGGMGGTPVRQGTGRFIWPSDFTGNVTSGFGPRQSPGGIGSRNHQGIDIAAPGINGTNVLAAASGVVTMSGWNGGFGNFIVINHGSGYATLYAHNSSNLVRAGDNVVQGTIIGRVGSTGNSTGPHIHFEVHRNGVPVNPMQFFN
ncbi:MAG: peptidoglycan DD-metalloendopeptidase family protein [Oscillospiraceae bacterium]|nr:peptidoglycan DD-metalloendopeptidase family protein [Oscillospiraceae bacterium]